jgi:hypothetical protein
MRFFFFFLTFTMFMVHSALANEIAVASPVPFSTLADCEAMQDTTATTDFVQYRITLAELKRENSDRNTVRAQPRKARLIRRATANSPALASNPIGGLLAPISALEKGDATRFATTASNEMAQCLLKELEGKKKLSVLTSPVIMCQVGTPAHCIIGRDLSELEFKILPVHYEDGNVFTEVIVRRTEMHDAENETLQMEISRKVPIDDKTSLVIGRKLGDKEVILVVTARIVPVNLLSNNDHSTETSYRN